MEQHGEKWPEQDAVENWFNEHRMELQKAVTQPRLKFQEKYDALEAENRTLREGLNKWLIDDENCDCDCALCKETRELLADKEES